MDLNSKNTKIRYQRKIAKKTFSQIDRLLSKVATNNIITPHNNWIMKNQISSEKICIVELFTWRKLKKISITYPMINLRFQEVSKDDFRKKLANLLKIQGKKQFMQKNQISLINYHKVMLIQILRISLHSNLLKIRKIFIILNQIK